MSKSEVHGSSNLKRKKMKKPIKKEYATAVAQGLFVLTVALFIIICIVKLHYLFNIYTIN